MRKVLVILLVAIGLYVSIAIHEAAHAAVLQLEGYTPVAIQIGFLDVTTINVVGIPVTFGLLPLGGATATPPGYHNAHWFLQILMMWAGPISTMLLAFTCFLTSGLGLKKIWEILRSTVQVYLETLVQFLPWTKRQEPKEGSQVTWSGRWEKMKKLSGGNIRAGLLAFGMLNYILAVVNLLPIPPMDGGNALLAIGYGFLGPGFEPISKALTYIGLGVIFIPMLKGLYYDLQELKQLSKEEAEQEEES